MSQTVPARRTDDRTSHAERRYERPADLPAFGAPPVVEVSMGVVVHDVPLRAVDLGGLRNLFEADYPIVEEAPPAPIQLESFSSHAPSGVQFQFTNRVPIPTLTFLSENRDSLIQIDGRKFFCAWRRTSVDAVYPRYETFRQGFIANLKKFEEFTESVGIEGVYLISSEVSYANLLDPDDEVDRNALVQSAGDIMSAVSGDAAQPSGVAASTSVTFATAAGVEYARLHVVSEPRRESDGDDQQGVALRMTYRGSAHERFPGAEPVDGVLRFLDEGHDLIVRTFTNRTTAPAHERWRRSK